MNAPAAAPRARRRAPSGVARLRAAGFNLSRWNPSTRSYDVRCSACEALVISGIACHERGCPNKAEADRARREDR